MHSMRGVGNSFKDQVGITILRGCSIYLVIGRHSKIIILIQWQVLHGHYLQQ
jgi:hypothetical protein